MNKKTNTNKGKDKYEKERKQVNMLLNFLVLVVLISLIVAPWKLGYFLTAFLLLVLMGIISKITTNCFGDSNGSK